MYHLHLTPTERETLEAWVKKGKSSANRIKCAQILLNSDENIYRVSSAILSPILGTSVRTIERVRRQFCEQGMALFEAKPRKTRSDKKIDGRVEAYLTTLLCQAPPDQKPTWKLQLLSERLIELQVVEHISTTMVARLIKKMN